MRPLISTSLLLLLLLSVWSACVSSQLRGQDEQIGEMEREMTKKRSEAFPPESCPLGMFNALREMSSTLGEQKAELRHSHTLLQSIETRLRETEAQLQQLRTENQELGKKDEEQTRKYKELQKTLQGQSEELRVLRDRSNITEDKVEDLRKNNEVRKVAFSAALLTTGEGHVGPFSVETTLVFARIFSNIGSAYNPITGIFTAPVKGIYEFKLFVYNQATPSVSSGASLHKNEERLVTAYSHNDSSQHVSSSNSVIVQMEVGDVVFVRLWANRRIFDSKQHHSTFSGHLLYTM